MKFLSKPLFLFCASFILLSLYFIRVQPLTTNDTYYHLAVGREVLETHKIPQRDNFVYGSAHTNYTSTEWLSGVFFYTLVHHFGFQSLLVLRVIFGLLTLYYLFKSLRLMNIRPLIINVSVLFVGYLLPYRLNSRPEMFSLAFLSLVNYVCLYLYFKKSIPPTAYFLSLLFLLWPNMHGFAPLGIILVTFFSAVFFLRSKKEKSLPQIYRLGGIIILTFVFITMQYQRIFAFLHTNTFSQYIPEWIDLWHRIFPTGPFVYFFRSASSDIIIFLTFFVLYIIFIFRTFKDSDQYQRAISIFYFLFLLLPFKFYRLITPIIVLSLPHFIFLAAQSFQKIALGNNRYLKILYTILFLIVFFSTLLRQQLGDEKVTVVYPEKAVKFIQSNLASRRLFTVDFWNDYFIWNIATVKTYADVMTSYRTLQDLEDERKLHQPGSNVIGLLKKYNIDTVVNTQPDAERIIYGSRTPLFDKPDWKLVYLDNISTVYARKDVIKNNVLDLSAIHPEFSTPSKYKLEEEDKAIDQFKNLLKFDYKNNFARSQLLYYYFVREKNLNKAHSLAQESRMLSPDDPFYSFMLAIIYLKQNDCTKAYNYANEALAKNKFDADLRNTTNAILNRCAL